MNFLEILGLTFVGIVALNFMSMVWAMRNAQMDESINLNADGEV